MNVLLFILHRTLILTNLILQLLLCGTWIVGLLFLNILIDDSSNPELSEALSWIFAILNTAQVHTYF